MIIRLTIKNVALIDEVEVDFSRGLNVLSGETGAGKSIVVDSINFLLGHRTSRDIIRAGAEFAQVEGVMEFESPLLEYVKEGLFELGLELEEGQIMLSRTMQADTGKNTCRVNGRTVTVGVLKSAAELLVDIHGQHEHQGLLDPVKQLQLLDRFCGDALDKPALEGLLLKYKENARELKKLVGSNQSEQIEVWRFQLNEIESAALKPDEEDGLNAKRDRLAGLERLSRNISGIISHLSGFTVPGQLSATDQTAKAVAMAAEIARYDPTQEKLHTALTEAHTILTEISADCRDYAEELDADPSELERIENRLDTIYKMKKKYGGTVEAVLKKQADLTAALNALENSEAEIARLNAIRKSITREITAICDNMHALREAKAAEISGQISQILQTLGMQNAKFDIDITRKTTFGPDGNSCAEFMISPNPGEPAKPLRKIASGGEMSRLMLAVKTVMASADRISTVIFDEVDTGVSGRTAQQVAQNLMNVSRHRQILCITHLPQIAAMADNHMLIEKGVVAGRTVTTVNALTQEGIINELARLTGGAEITAATLEAAKVMKEQADALKI